MNDYFSCCRNCTQPKRHPGCHDHCDAYISAKGQYDHDKAVYERDILLKYYANEKSAMVKDGIAKYIKKRPKNKHFDN